MLSVICGNSFRTKLIMQTEGDTGSGQSRPQACDGALFFGAQPLLQSPVQSVVPAKGRVLGGSLFIQGSLEPAQPHARHSGGV